MRARAIAVCCVLFVSSGLLAAPSVDAKIVLCSGKKAKIKGTNGNDTLNGTPNRDIIAGRGGNDTINGLGGNDIICGGSGNDTINGGLGDDKVLGQAGNDALIDHDGTANKLSGSDGIDDCTVEAGNTLIKCEPTTTHSTPSGLDVTGSPVNDNSPEVSGTSDAGTTVRIFTSTDCSGISVGIGTATAFFVTGITVTVADNTTTTFRAVALSPAENPSGCSAPSPAYVEDSLAPNAPSSLSTDPASPSSSNTPNLKGTADANTIVHVFETTDCSGTSNVGGGSSDFLSPGFQLSVATDTVTTLSAHAVDDAGNVSTCSASISYTEDSSAPSQPTFTGTDPSSPGSSTTPKIQGTAEDDSTVKLYTAGDCSTGGVVNSGSEDTFVSPGIEVSVADGATATFWASSTDAAGNVSACSSSFIEYHADATAPNAPTIDSSSPASPADDPSPEIKGTAEAGSTVNLYDDGTCTGTLIASGDASDFASTGLTVTIPEDATTVLSAQAVDEADNVSNCSSSFSYTEQSFVYVTGHIGSDGNPGTKTAPLAKIQDGINKAQTFSPPLDVKVSAGISYSEDITLAEGTSVSGGYVCIIVGCSWATTTARATIINSNSNGGVIVGSTITRDTAFERFEVIPRPPGGGFTPGTRSGMTIAGGSPTVTNNLFREANNSINNNFAHTIWQTVAPASGSGPLIKNNIIRAGSSNAASSWAVYAVGAIEIDSNVVNADDTSLVGSCTNPNAVTGCGGVYLDGGHGRVINNVIYGLPSANLNSAIHAANPSGAVLIVNNYLDGRGTGSNATSAGIYVRSPSGVQTFGYIRNNILLGGSATGAYGVFEGQFPGTQAHPEAVTNNDFRSSYSAWNGSTAATHTGAVAININVANAEDNIDNDCLVDSNFRIPSGSACENAGTATDAPSTDRDGDARPFGGDVDIGPDERTS